MRPNRHARRDHPKDLTTTTAQGPAPLLRWHYGPTALDSDPRKMWHSDCGGEVQIVDGGHVCLSCDMQQPPADEEPTEPSPAGLDDVATMLERTTANLASYIETRAAQIAQAAIDEHKATTDETIDDLERTLTRNNQRADDLHAEIRRQMRALERQRIQAGYAARHLPEHIKAAAGIEWVDRIPDSDLEQLGDGWTARVDHVTESQLRAHAQDIIAELNARLRARNAPEKHAVVLTAGPPDLLRPADELPDPGTDRDLMLEAAAAVITAQRGNANLIQREVGVGFAEAGRLLELLEAYSVVGSARGSKVRDGRDVLVAKADLETALDRLKEATAATPPLVAVKK